MSGSAQWQGLGDGVADRQRVTPPNPEVSIQSRVFPVAFAAGVYFTFKIAKTGTGVIIGTSSLFINYKQ